MVFSYFPEEFYVYIFILVAKLLLNSLCLSDSPSVTLWRNGIDNWNFYWKFPWHICLYSIHCLVRQSLVHFYKTSIFLLKVFLIFFDFAHILSFFLSYYNKHLLYNHFVRLYISWFFYASLLIDSINISYFNFLYLLCGFISFWDEAAIC